LKARPLSVKRFLPQRESGVDMEESGSFLKKKNQKISVYGGPLPGFRHTPP
jgi:hypothetical protein